MGRLFGSDKKAVAHELEAALDEAATAFEEGRFSDAQKAAERAVKHAPRSAEGWHFLGAARFELGAYEEARQAFEKGIQVGPEDLELARTYVELLVGPFGEERDRVQEAVALCIRARKRAEKQKDLELELDFLLLEGTARNLLGENRQALQVLDALLEREPQSAEARLERAFALFELCDFKRAEAAFQEVLTRNPDDAHALHTLGLMAERRGDEKEAKRLFARARELAPEDFPPPVELGDEAFDSVVEDALKRLPDNVKQYLENVTVAVEPVPPEEDLLGSEPPLSPTILGMFRGTPVGERSITRSEDHFPAAIVLYQRNLERFARTREELIEQIGITVMHEFGHLIGLDEEDLWERGLD